MMLADAFLLMTGVSYFFAAVLPMQFEKNMDLKMQKIVYLVAGIVLTLLSLLDFKLIPVPVGIAYACFALLAYGGKQDWGSVQHNLLMTVWDLLVSLACFCKLGVP